MEEVTLITAEDIQELSDLAKEKIRQEKQIIANANSFVNGYFKHRSYNVQSAVIEAYLKIVRDGILF